VRRHLKDKVPVSDLCEEYGIQPSMFYQWQKVALDGLDGLFEGASNKGRNSQQSDARKAEQRIAVFEAKLARKDEVIAEVSAEYVGLKKVLGRFEWWVGPT
jgi:transposase-like protein